MSKGDMAPNKRSEKKMERHYFDISVKSNERSGFKRFQENDDILHVLCLNLAVIRVPRKTLLKFPISTLLDRQGYSRDSSYINKS